MKRLWPRRDPDGENGQALILIAVMFPLLVLLMGVGIEGGRVFAEHQQVQSAADVSALAGAQALPCSTTDTTCITNAEQVACDYAKDNGVTSCSPGTGSYPSADVPPVSCSPYDFEDYGNGATNPKCKSATAPPFYDYVEVQLTKSLGVVPIFQIPVTVSAHAVAKHGVLEPGDFALVTLNTTCPSMNMTGSNETTIIGSAFSNGCISGNGSLTCSGGWFASGSISGVTTEDGGTPSYSPPACGAGSGPGMPPQGSLPGEADPYKGSLPPPTVTGNGNPNSGTFPSCQECTQAGWWFSFDTKTWTQGGNPSGH
ncbi:MAG: pilus assembly protein TadG-related protein, partial [Chloroflexota bacterium]